MRASLFLVMLATAGLPPTVPPVAPTNPSWPAGRSLEASAPGSIRAKAAVAGPDRTRPDSLNPFGSLAAPLIRGGT